MTAGKFIPEPSTTSFDCQTQSITSVESKPTKVEKIDLAPQEGGYDDLLASHDEVTSFLSKDVAELSLRSNQGQSTTRKPEKQMSIQDGSDSSRLADEYHSFASNKSSDFENLAQNYNDNSIEERSASADTVTGNKHNLVSPSPSPVKVKNKAKTSHVTYNTVEQAQKQTRDVHIQTDEYHPASNQFQGFPSLDYIPMPPLMPFSGYSEFADWLESQNSLIYKSKCCSCACHSFSPETE